MSADSPLLDLTAFQRDALAVAAGLDDPIGREIKTELEAVYGRGINSGQLYPNLSALVETGLVEVEEKSGRANYYRATSEGERAIEAHVEWLESQLGDGSSRDGGDTTTTDGGGSNESAG